MRIEVRTSTPGETRELGEAIAALLRPRDTVILTGELGAGKTTFAQGVARGLGIEENISSPTFTLVKEYTGILDLAHVDAVHWVGHVDDVVPWYHAADVSIAPSRSENHGAAGEASLLAVPTIASRVGGLPELVIEDETGWLVPPDDPEALMAALRRAIAAGPEERQARGERARVRALVRYARENTVEPFADLVEAVVRRG